MADDTDKARSLITPGPASPRELGGEESRMSGADNSQEKETVSIQSDRQTSWTGNGRGASLSDRIDLPSIMAQCLSDFFGAHYRPSIHPHSEMGNRHQPGWSNLTRVGAGDEGGEVIETQSRVGRVHRVQDGVGVQGQEDRGGQERGLGDRGEKERGRRDGGEKERGWNDISKQVGLTKPSHNFGGGSGAGHWRSQIPKQLYFTGEDLSQGEWKSYTFQLEMYIENMDLGPLDSKRLLFYTLRGRALNYAVSMDESNPGIGYRDLMRQMKVRFGAEIRCETAYLRLQNAVQERGEALYEWADRLCDLARKAVTSGQGSSNVLNVMVVMRFCMGCRDRKTGTKVYEQGPPESLGEAIRKVEWLQHIDDASKMGGGFLDKGQGRDQEWHELRDRNPRVYQVARCHMDGIGEAYAGCANSKQWQGDGLERTSQLSVQAVGQVAYTNQGFERRLGRLENLVTESLEKLTAKVDQLAQEVRGVKMELKELGTATAVNKAGLEELCRGRAYERSPSTGRVFNESRSRSTSPRGCFKC